MKNLRSHQQIEAEFIKDTQASVPDIIKNLNPATEHFDTIPKSSEPTEVKKIVVQEHASFLHHLLSDAEQLVCNTGTD